MGRLFFFYSVVCFVLLRQSFSSSFVHHLCSPSEASALHQFKQSFRISDNLSCSDDKGRHYGFPKTMSWNESRDCCTWDGITCDLLTGYVISLDLSCSLLYGSIHPNSSLFQLHHLQTLNLAYNEFYPSSIPNSIGRLRNLRDLNLSNSGFRGKIPTEISYLSNLISLDLSLRGYSNQIDQKTFETLLHNFTKLEVVSLFGIDISSTIPMNLSSSLRCVDLEATNLQGVLTESFFLLPNLERLKLGWNDLQGVLPKIHPSNTLLELHISFTGISGELPDSIGTLKSLNQLNAERCDLSGSIPDSIGNLTQIRKLSLRHNQFTGHIPSTISKLKQLTLLDLSSNSLGGEFPDIFSNLQELVSLYVYSNSFIGPFPSSILSLTRLESLVLSSNSLSGPLPSNASMLQKLVILDLSDNSLNGTIPSWMFSPPLLSLLKLDHNQLSGLADELKTNLALQYLDLSHNQLSSPVLRSLGNLTNLDLSSNNITDDAGIEVPNWFSSMRWNSLQFLNLSHNSLTGLLQQFNYYKLKHLDLKFNSLQGPLPSSICNMSSLGVLDLSYNYFSDSVPHCLGSMAKLSVLDLRMNNFSGSLPPLCTRSTSSLRTIVLNGNRFEGLVPMSLFNCVGLEVLDMGNNIINDTFPAWLGTLEWLQVLILKSNKFHGPVSTRKKSCFPRLRIFDLSHNEFSGSLPAEVFGNFKAMKKNGTNKGYIGYMGNSHNFSLPLYEDSVRLVIKGNDIEVERISTIMTTIDLSSNHFEGVIPKTLKDLSSLWLLNLSRNNLKGDIPMELGQLNMLEALDLSWNQLTGKIPRELTSLSFLSVLNLSQNLLVGGIPRGSQFNTFENDSYGGNLDLCGPPLSKQCGTRDPPLESEEEEEEEDESYFASGFTWESVVIGYSCGFVVGTFVWNVVFKTGKPKWFVEFF